MIRGGGVTALSGLLLLTAFAAALPGQGERHRTRVDAAWLRGQVEALCADAMGGRRGASPGAWLAAHHVAQAFCRAGLRPAGDGGSYFQLFDLDKGKDKGRVPNVLGRLGGRGPLASQVVVLCAHYDHLGLGGGESRWQGEPALHRGANDNAAGVAALVAVARLLAPMRDAPGRTLLFAAWGAEELGSVGARWWLAHPTLPGARVTAVVNLDMVGRLKPGGGGAERPALLAAGVGSARGLDLAALAGDGLRFRAIPRSFGGSDHQAFLDRGMPALHLFTGLDEAYHTPADTPERIDYPGLLQVADATGRLLRHLARRPEPYPFDRKGAGLVPKPPPSGARPAFGSVPDFGQVRGGYKVARVKPGTPAARAGIRAGDLIVAFAGRPVDGFMGFVQELFRHRPGQKVAVELLRAGRRHRVEVTLGKAAARGHGGRGGPGRGHPGAGRPGGGHPGAGGGRRPAPEPGHPRRRL